LAIEAERMVVILEGRVDQLEKASERARQKLTGDFTAITTAGSKMEAAIGRLGGGARKNLDAAAKSAASLRGQTGNLAAQFNDIGVQLAGGQSPLLIALQQGSQINQVLGQAGARGAVTALGGAFMSLLNPVSLATIAAITLGGTVIQYFTSLISEGEKSEETLKAQAQLIDAVATKWGDAHPAIKAYNDELKRAQDQADQAAGQELVKEAKIKPVVDLIDELNVNIGIWREQLQNAGMDSVVFDDLQRKLQASSDKMRDGKSESAALAGAMDTLRSGIEDQSNPALVAMIDLLGQLQLAASKAAGEVAKVYPSKFPARPEFTTANDAPDPRYQLPGTGPTPGEKPNLLDYDPNDTGRRSTSSGSKTDAFQSATQSIEERTKALDAQFQAQSKLNPLINDYGYAVEYAKAKQELLTAAEKAKKAVTPQMAADIDKVAAAYARTSAELQKLAEENRKAAEAVQFQKDLVNGALSDMRSALEDGKLTWEDLGNVAVNVLNKIADRLQTMLVDQMFSKGFGGLFGSFTGIGGGVSGTSGGVGAPAVSAAATATPRLASAPSMPKMGAMKQSANNVHVTVGLVKNGLNIEPEVVSVASKVGRAGLEQYRRGQARQDARDAVRNPRRNG
jgi:hypothetical protein